METIWKVFSCFVALLFLELCNGLPLDLDHSYADGHTQFLTGLIAVLLTICGVVCLAGCLCCQRRNGFKEFRDSPVVISVASNLDHGHVNPIANGEFTIFTPLSPPHHNNNVFLANQQVITRAEEDFRNGDIDVTSWFDTNEKDFPRTKLKYIKEFGKGWFGRVVEGTAQGLEDDTVWTPVIVRILEATASSRQRVLFLHDAAIYRCPPHPNLLKLLGRSLESIPLLLLQEHSTQGDLKLYLRKQQQTKESFLSSELPLRWCHQLASAVKHLHDYNITHRDLAARNCQISQELDLKLGDYGCSTSDYPEDYYHGTENVPVRWCAPECVSYTATTIQTKNVTMASNIWSLGVCLWEIYECGEQPYSSLTDDEVVSQVLGPPNVRLTKPSFTVLYTDYVYKLMQLCWLTHELRPSISQIDLMLVDLVQVHKNTSITNEDPPVSIQDFDSRWENLKPNVIVKKHNHILQINEPENDLTNITVLNMSMKSDQDSKRLSASLHNLAGSFDNLLETSGKSDISWLDNVESDDLSFAKGLSDAIHDLDSAIAAENLSSSDSSPRPAQTSKLQFKLGPTSTDMLLQRTSSESETEDELWKKKIERGAYTEKVRIKSRSVADLMVLTHIDCSESDSETPLPSLDYRFNYKNVRYGPKQNLENVSLTFGSEGNLLNVQDTFQQELKKLQEERRDSLLFVPDNTKESHILTNSPETKKVLEDLNSPANLEPQKQVFNVYNVVAISPKYSPVHKTDLKQIINYKDDVEKKQALPDLVLNTIESNRDIPKLSEIIENNIELMDYIVMKYDSSTEMNSIEDIDYTKSNYIDKNEINKVKSESVMDMDIINHDQVIDNKCNVIKEKLSITPASQSELNHYNGTDVDIKNEINEVDLTDVDIKIEDNESKKDNSFLFCDKSTHGQCDNEVIETITSTSADKPHLSNTDNLGWVEISKQNFKSAACIPQYFANSETNKNIPEQYNSESNVHEFIQENIQLSSDSRELELIVTNSENIVESVNEVVINGYEGENVKLKEETNNIDKINETTNFVVFEEVDRTCDNHLVNQALNLTVINGNILKESELNNSNTISEPTESTNENIEQKIVENKSTNIIPEENLHNDLKSLSAETNYSTDSKSKTTEPSEKLLTKSINPIILKNAPEEMKLPIVESMVQEEKNCSSFQEVSINDIQTKENPHLVTYKNLDNEAKCVVDKFPVDGCKADDIEFAVPKESENEWGEKVIHSEASTTSKEGNIEKVRNDLESNFNYLTEFINKESYTNIFSKDTDNNTNEPVLVSKSEDCQQMNVEGIKLVSKNLSELNDIKSEEKVQFLNIQKTKNIKMNEVQPINEINSTNKINASKIQESKSILVSNNEPQDLITEPHLANNNDTKCLIACITNSVTHEGSDKIEQTVNRASNNFENSEMFLKDVPKSDIAEFNAVISKNQNIDCAEVTNITPELFEYKVDSSITNGNLFINGVEDKNIELSEISNSDLITRKLECNEISNKKYVSNELPVIHPKIDHENLNFSAICNDEDKTSDSVNVNLSTSEEKKYTNTDSIKIQNSVDAVNMNNLTTEETVPLHTALESDENPDTKSSDSNYDKLFQTNSDVIQMKTNIYKQNSTVPSYASSSEFEEHSIILDELGNNSQQVTVDNLTMTLQTDKNIIQSEMVNESIDVDILPISSASSNKSLDETNFLSKKLLVDSNTDLENVVNVAKNTGLNSTESIKTDSKFEEKRNVEIDNIDNIDIHDTIEMIKDNHIVETNKLGEKIQCEKSESTCIDNIIDKTIIINSSLKQLESSRSESLLPSSAKEGSDHETGDLDQNLARENECTLLSKPPKCDSPVSESNRDTLLSPKLEYVNTENADNKSASSAADSESAHRTVTVLFGSDKSVIVKTHDFLICEILKYDDSNLSGRVKFDLSKMQDECAANSLTHATVTSTPFKRPNQENTVILGASDDYSIGYYSGLKTTNDERETFSSNFVQPALNKSSKSNPDLKYSLETWDNFLGRSFDEQREFDGFSSEPQSMLFLDNNPVDEQKLNNEQVQENLSAKLNSTFTVDDLNRTYDIIDSDVSRDNTVDLSDINVEMEDLAEGKEGYDNPGYWENETSGGWFLHPQTSGEDVSGQMDVSEDDSYVGFSMDDEIMAAIRNELLTKLPQAQRASAEQIDDGDGEYETSDRNEVFVRYNCYNTPLSPIPEESYSELLHSGQSTPHCTINTDIGDADSDWSEPGLDPNSILDDDTHSPRIIESPHKGPLHRHTPSQDSCCSNDTLFNLEELQYTEKNLETQEKMNTVPIDVMPTKIDADDSIQEENSKKEDETESPFIPVEPESPSMVTTKQSELSISTQGNLVHENETIDSSLPSSTDNTTMKLVTQLECVTECESNCQPEANSTMIDKIVEQVEVTNTPSTEIEESEKSPNKDVVECSENLVSSEREFVLRIQPTINLDISPTYSADFINAEKQNSSCEVKPMPVIRKDVEESSSGSETYLTVSDGYVLPNVAPLNSPEDRPWKHIEASLSRCPPELPETDDISAENILPVEYLPQAKCSNSEDGTLSSNSEEEYGNDYENIEEMNLKNALVSIKTDYVNVDKNINGDIYDCIDVKASNAKPEGKEIIKLNPEYVNDIPTYINDSKQAPIYTNDIPTYASCDQRSATAQYVNTQPEYENHKEIPIVYENMNYDVYIDLLNNDPEVEYDNIDSRGSVEDVYGPLTDIRFTGPGDSQMMTTSFSDSNDLGDEQDWDSGSDTRSSSSGEFIWKEGEHEASVKALHAAPQEAETRQDDIHQDEEESTSGSEEDCDGPEFVPSAWDKYAAPTKSALRSPEKTVDRQPKKSRGVSFKKQKYHCVYEYPREPDSPVIPSFDIWQDPNNSIDWDVDRDSDPFLPATSDTETISESPSVTPQNHSNRPHRNLYQTSNVPDFMGSSIQDDDFYISSSAKPFDMFSTPSSQFFPGRHCDWSELIKNNDNVTPDSGVEDITPGSLSDSSEYVRPSRQILPLKTLAQLVLNKGTQSGNNEIGGLRHTRNRLKLDLPPSPSAFTKTFSIEPILDPVVNRQVPTFTTFGKSRFVVQQVDTPTDDNINMKNVSFEALPYKPMTTHIYRDDPSIEKHRVEIVRGEASLLDSADEDSGIESCTLERKRVSEVPLKF